MGKHSGDRDLNPVEKDRRKDKQRTRDKASYLRSYRKKVAVDPEAMRKALANLTRSFKARTLDQKGKLRMEVLTGVMEELESGRLRPTPASDLVGGDDGNTSSSSEDDAKAPEPVKVTPVTGPAWAAVFMGGRQAEVVVTSSPKDVLPHRQPPAVKRPLFTPTSVLMRQPVLDYSHRSSPSTFVPTIRAPPLPPAAAPVIIERIDDDAIDLAPDD